MEFLHLNAEAAIDFRASNFRMEDGIQTLRLQGHASTFGSVNTYDEVVDRGAFEESIRLYGPRPAPEGSPGPAIRSDVKCLYQHQQKVVMGLPHVLQEDSVGLFHETLIADTPDNRSYMALIEIGAVDKFSIGFKRKDDYQADDEMRHIRNLRLYEYSPVTFPAEINASVAYGAEADELRAMIQHYGKEMLTEWASAYHADSMAFLDWGINALTTWRQDLADSTYQGDQPQGDQPQGDQTRDEPTPPTVLEDPEFGRRLIDIGTRAVAATLDYKARQATNDRRSA